MMTHDDKRHGTTTLFAALDVKSGMVIGECLPRHRAKEFLRFLRRIDRAVLKPRDMHLVLDSEPDQKSVRGTDFPANATHKTPEVKAWLDKHPRFKLHFTPTSASWLNLVERFFAAITTRRIRRGSSSSVGNLETLTLTAPGAGLRHYITGLRIERHAAALLTAGTTPVVITTTNLPGALAFFIPMEAAAQGSVYEKSLDSARAVMASAQNTATTIVAPLTTSVIWRISATFYVAP